MYTCEMRMKKKSQQGTFKQHTEPYKAGVCRFYQSEQLWVFSSPRTWALGPRTSCRENLRSVVNEESLVLILDTHNYAVAFLYSFDKRCKCFELCCFPLFLSLVLQFFQGKRRKRTDFLPGRRKDILFCYWFLKWDEGMGRENKKSWAIQFSS